MVKPKICVVGPGVVGQATGKVFVEHGFETAFLGGRQEKRDKLKEEGYTTYDTTELFDGDYDFDITMFTVPTPTKDGKINLEPMKAATKDLGKRLKKTKKYHLVVVKSTVLPGTTEEIVIPLVEKYSGKKLGKDFGACMNPEYLREESAYDDTAKPWLIVIGEHDQKSGDLLYEVYRNFDCSIHRVPIKEAEMQKYIHNLFNAAKITYFNEMRQVAKELGIDAEKMFQLTAASTEGMWNPHYGIKDKGPFDGSCLPKDTQAFFTWAKEKGYDVRLLEATIDVNKSLKKKLGITNHHVEYTL